MNMSISSMDSYKNLYYFGSEEGHIHKLGIDSRNNQAYKIHDDRVVSLKIIANKYLHLL